MVDGSDAAYVIVISSICGLLFAAFQYWKVSQTSVDPDSPGFDAEYRELHGDDAAGDAERSRTLFKLYNQIGEGARAFLYAEYKICAVFLVLFGIVILVLTSHTTNGWNWTSGFLSALAFWIGGITSIVSGYVGMVVAVYANARTTVCASKNGSAGWTAAFNCAFQAGGVMGFSLTGLALIVCYILCIAYSRHFSDWATNFDKNGNPATAPLLFECLSGFGLGGSSIAMFGRVGGGIYTKAADVGADLAGKVLMGIDEDDPRNAAVIADNVGDNVGDVAGMGSDLFGSFAEGTCAALVVAANSRELVTAGWGALMFPLCVSAAGILVSIVCSFLATDVSPVREEADVEKVLKVQLGATSVVMTVVLYPIANAFLPAKFSIGDLTNVTPVDAFVCVIVGLWAGCLIGFITEYYTSHSYQPVRDVANSCHTGAATNIIYGLALGYKSLIAPIFLLAIAVFVSFTLAGMYGVALAALGMLSTLATCLSIDVYGPVCDNAGGIAEMAHYPPYVREKTDALDAAGNTTAAIGKGFAIGSACLVALALFGAFVTRANLTVINVLRPITFSFILIGAMIPYWFTSMTMKSVGEAAMEMVKEVQRQWNEIPGLKEGRVDPDAATCIKISTDASLKEMIMPGMLVILTPIIVGVFFGVEAVSGLLTGSITSGVQLAISQSNSGGAWDNAKKYVESGNVADDKGQVQGKGTEVHKAAVCGDTVGDPLKDTSGPAINIVMKLQAIISLVFAEFFVSINGGRGIFNVAQASTK
jgi:inorganic pyrophosphatase